MRNDETAGREVFWTTHWTSVLLASQQDREAGELALDRLLRQYSPPLLKHLRCRFRVPEQQAEEWLQAFIVQRVLEKHLLAKADRRRGRFRTFLLTALDRFVYDQLRARSSPIQAAQSLDLSFDNAPALADTLPAALPPDPFDVDWAATVLKEAKDRTRAFYEAKGRGSTWAVFEDGTLLAKGERPPSTELAVRNGFASAREADNAILTGKREFGKQLRAVVAEYTNDESEIDEEIRELIRILSEIG
jgi:DNA-directed RNA polymerase specialized sigma24 family protein